MKSILLLINETPRNKECRLAICVSKHLPWKLRCCQLTIVKQIKFYYSGLNYIILWAKIPMEVFKELDGESMETIAKIMSYECVVGKKYIDEKYLRATVCLIYKKGNTSMLENYRPISFLNCLYKIFAAIVQKRMAAQIDEYHTIWFQKKQKHGRCNTLCKKNCRTWRANENTNAYGPIGLGEGIR